YRTLCSADAVAYELRPWSGPLRNSVQGARRSALRGRASTEKMMSKAKLTGLPTVDDSPIWRVWLSAFHAPCMVIADELGIFRELRDEGATAAELAQRVSIELRAMETILALLRSLELLVHADGRFHLAEVSRHCLLPESPYYWGGFLKRIRDTPTDVRVLLGSLRSGTAAADGRVARHWEAASPPPEFLRDFTHAMHAHS